MRVIGGKFGGKRLLSPTGNLVRPTTDRIKETLFNILFSKGKSEGITTLDLFAGSGALSIEALSRGAERAVIVDSSPVSMRLVKSNLSLVGADPASFELLRIDFTAAMKTLAGRAFDVIFADPPYAAGYENAIVEGVVKLGLLDKNGILVIEHAADNSFCTMGLAEDRRKCGSTALSFLSYPKEAEHNE